MTVQFAVLVRPGVKEFLEHAARTYELVVFTASVEPVGKRKGGGEGSS